MDELVELVADKAGISKEQAQKAVDAVIGYMKDNLPEPFAGQVEGLLAGDVSGLGDIAGSLGGLFGKK